MDDTSLSESLFRSGGSVLNLRKLLLALFYNSVLAGSQIQLHLKCWDGMFLTENANRKQGLEHKFSFPQSKQFLISIVYIKHEIPWRAWRHALRGAVYCNKYVGGWTGCYLWGDRWSRWYTWWQRCHLVLVWLLESVLQNSANIISLNWMCLKCIAKISCLFWVCSTSFVAKTKVKTYTELT